MNTQSIVLTISVGFASIVSGSCSRVSNSEGISYRPTPVEVAPTNTPKHDEIIQRPDAILKTPSDAPVRIFNMRHVAGDRHSNPLVYLDLENTSTKTIKKILIGFSPPPNCLAFYESGDMLVDSSEGPKKESLLLEPEMKRSLQIPDDVVRAFLIQSSYDDKCPVNERTPVIYVWGAEFEDGTKWAKGE